MNDRTPSERGPALGRWLLVAALLLVGIGLYFWFAPSNQPAVTPAGQEEP